jgi:WD40 repeat protein
MAQVGASGGPSVVSDAFISYATDADYDLARDLEAFLELFHELPTPEGLTLAPMVVWRDGSGARRRPEDTPDTLRAILLEATARARHLIVLWSEAARESAWMHLEIDAFVRARGLGAVMLCITDALDPVAGDSELFTPAVRAHGLDRLIWYDLRGFRPRSGARRLRDYEEECVRLAADLCGLEAGVIQPLWWRNKARQEAQRAEAEQQNREALELSELEARLQTSEAWTERAAAHLERDEHHNACERLLDALAAAPPDKTPAHFAPEPGREGWACGANGFLGCLAPSLPERLEAFSCDSPLSGEKLAWFDEGRRCLVVGRSEARVWRLEGSQAHLEWSGLPTTTPGDPPPRHAAMLPASLTEERHDAQASGALRAPRLVIRAADQAAWAVDLITGEVTRLLDAPKRPQKHAVSAVGISSDGREIVIASAHERSATVVVEVRAWPGRDCRLKVSLGRLRDGQDLSWAGFSADGRRIGVAVGETLNVLDSTGRPHGKAPVSAFSRENVVSPNLGFVAFPKYDLWQLATVAERDEAANRSPPSTTTVMQGASGLISSLAFTADAAQVLTVSGRGDVHLWSTARPELTRGMSFAGAVITQNFGADSRGRPVSALAGLGSAGAVAPHPTLPDQVLVMGHGRLEAWRLPRFDQPIEPTFPDGAAACASIDVDSGSIAVGTERQGVLLHDDQGARRIPTVSAVWDVALAGTQVAAAVAGGNVQVWDRTTLENIHAMRLGAEVSALAYDPDGKSLLIGLDEGTLWRWNPPETPVRLGALGIGRIRRLRLTPDGASILAAGGNDDLEDDDMTGGVACWTLGVGLSWTAEEIGPVHDLDISRAGDRVVAAGSLEAFVLDAKSGKRLSSFMPPQQDLSKPHKTTALCFGPDDRTVFFGMWDGSVALLDIFTQRELRVFKAHGKYVASVVADRCRGRVVTTSPVGFDRGQVAVWQGWDPDFFEAPPIAPGWGSRASAIFCQRYGDLRLRPGPLRREPLAERLPSTPEARLAWARGTGDKSRAGEVFAGVVKAFGDGALSPDELVSAAIVLLQEGSVDHARRILPRAAEAGQLRAHSMLGHVLLQDGRGSWNEALPHFRIAADGGDPVAAYFLGRYHDTEQRGLVGETDWRALAAPKLPEDHVARASPEAIRWYGVAAEAGLPDAAFRLSQLLREGAPSADDLVRADALLRQAAERGHPDAAQELQEEPL